MHLIKFRIKNYKSIIDSMDCYFSDRLTIFAGKNESGKTSVLEALEDFHQDRTIREEAKPIQGEGIPEISITFNLTSTEVNDIFKSISPSKKVSKNVTFTLSKRYGGSRYTIDSSGRDQIGISSIYNVSLAKIREAEKKASELIEKSALEVDFPKFAKQSLKVYKEESINFKNQHSDLTDIVSEVLKIEKASDDFYAQEKLLSDFITKFVELLLPYFILFSSFDDEFPKSIPVEGLSVNEWAKDLEHVSDFSIEKMASTNQQAQINHENSVNVDFTKKFKKFWTQDNIKLQVKKDGSNINFWIVENNRSYFPSQRSKGQQWYLSFYIRIVARLRENKPNIILIDEPGLYLHAKAQKDLLNVLLEHTNDNPVIFSTHSPYLITEDNLENVRLIEKNKEGTKILGKIHAHPTADRETLTPVLTAIGLGINDSITNLDQKNNVVVEGPEDVFYLRAFKELENSDFKINFINGGGAPNMGTVGAVLEGWGANVLYLYDNDQGKKDGEKKLKSWHVLPEVIKKVLQEENTTIVDIFSVDDFKNLVLNDPGLSYTKSNSDYIKNANPRHDKVLLARKFLQKSRAGGVVLSAATKKNIKFLFEEIKF